MTEAALRVRLLVRGRVQGVGFRWFVRERARAAGLAGWVRNLPDGTVELEASGAGEAVERLAAAVAQGPPGASVTSVERTDAAAGPPLPLPFHVER